MITVDYNSIEDGYLVTYEAFADDTEELGIGDRVHTMDPDGNRCDAVVVAHAGDELVLAIDADTFSTAGTFAHASA